MSNKDIIDEVMRVFGETGRMDKALHYLREKVKQMVNVTQEDGKKS